MRSKTSHLYYFGEDGNKVVNSTINIGGVQYIIDEDGDVTISEEQSDQVDSRLIEMFKEGMKYLGTYYSSDVNQGIDCSQFITYMLQMADIDLTDLAFIQYYEFRNNLDYEIYYDIESLQPGDLIFYYSMDCEYGDNCEFWNEIHHVAMYMGDGKLIEATGNPGYTLIQDFHDEDRNFVAMIVRVI